MNIQAAFPSQYLKASDMDEDVTYTIAKVELETVGQGKDAEEKPILYFEEVDKGCVLNKTNANTIAKLLGHETDQWIGKQITLFATEVQFGNDMVMAIRVRMRTPAVAKKVANTATTQPISPATTATPRNAAVNAFRAKTPSWDVTKQKAEWPKVVGEKFPDRVESTLTADEWTSLAAAITEDYDEGLATFLQF